MAEKHLGLLERYLKLPDRLEAAIAGLSEADLDLTLGEGWSIRAYVHHTVEGEYLWQVLLRTIVGNDGIELPFQWYFTRSQDAWAESWGYHKRPVGPALELFRANTRSLVEFLRCMPDVWERSGRITWPGKATESRYSVRDIVLMHIGHMDQHVEDIAAIRAKHGK